MSKFTNPMLQKLSKITEKEEGQASTYRGIGLKTLYFLVMTVVGAALYFVVHSMSGGNTLYTLNGIPVSTVEGICFIVALLFVGLSPFLVWLMKPLTPLLGTLYSLSQGFAIAMTATFVPEYQHLIYIAFVITMLIVFVMLVLYTKRIVTVGHRFKTVITTLFCTTILGSVAYGLLFLIVPQNPIVQWVQSADGIFSIFLSLIGIIIAACFLLSDFDRIERTVEDQLPKKYEWIASFGLVFTVIWLYMKVLHLLSKIEEKKA